MDLKNFNFTHTQTKKRKDFYSNAYEALNKQYVIFLMSNRLLKASLIFFSFF
jgi:hypothetical protein